MNAAKESNLKNLNVVPTCKVGVTNWDTGKLDIVAVVLYTPRAINQAFVDHNLEGYNWVIGPVGRELWKASPSGLAVK